MNMATRCLLMIGGVALLLLTACCLVVWAVGFTSLKEALLDGVPVFLQSGEDQIRVPGRVIGLISVILPLAAVFGGVWLIRLALARETERKN